jgi:hypothetical protein
VEILPESGEDGRMSGANMKRPLAMFSPTLLSYYVLSLGVFVRLWQLSMNRSLWLDESSLALNILSRNFFELTEPLSGRQAAPMLFLWLMKATTLIADTSSEMSLRFVPFLSGVAALIGFYFCCKEVLSRQGTLIALAFFAFSPGLIDFSAEAKQYSTDVFVSVVITYLGFRLISVPSLNTILSSIFIPAVLIWLSYPTPFLLSAIGLVGICQALLRKDKIQVWYLSIAIFIWLVSFILFYLHSLEEIGSRQDLVNYWQEMHDAFMPLVWVGALFWLAAKAKELLGMPALGPSIIMLPMALAGVVILALRDWRQALIVLMPIFVTVAASATKLYPFADRLILFLIPQVILLVAISAEGLLTIKWRYVALTLSLLAVSALLLYPIRWSAALVLKPANFEKENFRDVFANVLDSSDCDANIFIYESARNHYSYYHLYRGVDREGRAKVVTEPEIRDIVSERPACFWILYAHMPKSQEDTITEVLTNGRYRPVHHIMKIGADATLYVTDNGSESEPKTNHDPD